jgi:hypothetical protein
MRKPLPVIESFGRNKITPRQDQGHNLKKMVGRVLRSNMFPTMLGKLLYTENGKCYFIMIENPNMTKYNSCAGQIEYLKEDMVLTMQFEEDGKIS